MKTQRRRGFTVVELVVVIAIIAVLAAVLIPTFTSIIKKANDSAYLQERQSQQIADLAEKVDKINYFTWEDFEKKLAEELAKIGKAPSTEEIENAVAEAIKQYHGEQAGDNTGLTEDQVKKIIEEAMKGQLTTAQVEAIVNAAVSKNPTTSGLTEAQVKQIVNSAIAKIPTQTGISKTEMQNAIAAAIAEAGTGLTEKQVKAIVEKALAGFSTLTAEEVEQIVNAAIAASAPTTDKVYIAGDMTLAADTTYILRTMNALGTVTLTVPDGVTVKEIIIDAPNVQTVNIVYENNASALKAVQSLAIISTASTSTHVHVNVTNMEVNSGRAVVEGGATVGTLTAAPSTNANVVVELTNGSSVSNPIVAEYQDNGNGTNDTITIIDNAGNAKVKIDASEKLVESGTTTTNVVISNISVSNVSVDSSVKESEKITSSTMTLDVETTGDTPTSTSYFVDPESTEATKDVAQITVVYNYDELNSAITSGKKYIKFGADISYAVNGKGLLNILSSMTIDGDGYTLSGYGARGSNKTTLSINQNGTSWVDVVLKNLTIENNGSYGRPIETRGYLRSLTVDNTTISATGTGNNQGITIGGAQSTPANIVVRNSVIHANSAGYPIISFNPFKAIISDSIFEGYCGIYFRTDTYGANNCTVIANDTLFDSPNPYSYEGSNSFGVFAMENNLHDNTITLTRCYVNSKAENTALQGLLLNTYCSNIIVTINDGCFINGDLGLNTYFSTDSKIILNGGEYTKDPHYDSDMTKEYGGSIAEVADGKTIVYVEETGTYIVK